MVASARASLLAILAAPLAWGAVGGVHGAAAGGAGGKTLLRLESASFTDGGAIPERHTCDGADQSPSLSWTGVPEGTKSLALIVDDPDAPDPAAPKMTWVHWVLFNLPPGTTGLPGGVAAAALPPGAVEGLNDFKRPGYGGPCPPIGRHRYFFKLYALDAVLPVQAGARKADVERAMQGHVLGQATLVGTYRKK